MNTTSLAEKKFNKKSEKAEHLGDPDCWEVPQEPLLDDDYLRERAGSIDLQKATPSSAVQPLSLASLPENEETAHYSIVDIDGNAISVTITINASYGSKVLVQGAAFLLNNQMDGFSSNSEYR